MSASPPPPISWILGGDGLGTLQISARSHSQSQEVRTSLPEPHPLAYNLPGQLGSPPVSIFL